MANLQDHINSAKRSGNIEFFIEERNTDYVISRMPVTSGILNPFGTVQAGAMIWLADVTASVLAIAGQKNGDDGKGFPLAIDVHTTLVSNQRNGEIKAEARFVRRGQNVLVIRTSITGNEDKLLAEVTTTHIKAR
ncbi:MAG: PaaI family thioesterase [Desulfobacula sp.]|jgi:1,4-dihydroxy-2-naphthoyl-CoA hydrolase|nr:PaaI family thioesterase [Desulfobacula sp.]